MGEELKSVVITVADEALKNIAKLAEELHRKGLEVDRVMPITGVITGSVSASKMASLGSVGGVVGVEEEFTAQLPPRGAEVQ